MVATIPTMMTQQDKSNSSAEAALGWYALYTKPHCEATVFEALQVRGIEAYLPTIPVWRARRRQVEVESLFACYGFVHVDLKATGISLLRWVPGLRYIVTSDGAPTRISDRVVTYIQKRVATFTHEPRLPFAAGERVRITHGPLKDMEAVFTGRLSGPERAQVLVNLLGPLSRCEVKEEWLERA